MADSDTPTDRRSVRRSVGPSESWEEVKFLQGAVRNQRVGDTGDKGDRRLVGRSENERGN